HGSPSISAYRQSEWLAVLESTGRQKKCDGKGQGATHWVSASIRRAKDRHFFSNLPCFAPAGARRYWRRSQRPDRHAGLLRADCVNALREPSHTCRFGHMRDTSGACPDGFMGETQPELAASRDIARVRRPRSWLSPT